MIEERQAQREKLRQFLKEGERRQSPFYTLKASRERARLIANLFRKAYQKDSIVAWRNSFVPTEIFYALDIIPFAAEANCSMFASSKLSGRLLNLAEKNFYSTDTCSFLRCSLGATVEDYMPTPDFLVATTHYCDGAAKLFYNLAKRYKKDFFLLDIPYNYYTEKALDYTAGQIEKMMNTIAEKRSEKVNLNKLAEVIQLSNQARRYLFEVNELRKNVPSLMRGGEAIDYAIMISHTWGTEEIVEVYKTLYEELKEKVNNKGTLKSEKHRILWRNLRPYYNEMMMDYLENQCGVAIVFEEVNYIHWQEMNCQDLYRSLAQKIVSNQAIGEIEPWIEKTLNFIKEYSIDGVIEFAHWGCRHLSNGANILKTELDSRKIPFLILDGDCVDGRNFSWGQIKTRIDALLEVLEKRRKKR